MRRAATLLALLALSASRPATAGAPPPAVLLEGFDRVDGLRFARTSSEGGMSVLLSSGRELKAFRAAGKSFVKSALWAMRVPTPALFVWPGPDVGGLCLTPPAPQTARTSDDGPPIVLTEWVRPGHEFEPVPEGIRWRRKGGESLLPVPLRRKVTPAGPFLEEATVATTDWPDPFLVPAWAPASALPAAFFLGDDSIDAFVANGAQIVRVRWATGFLPPVKEGRALLVDLDGDGTPDLAHEVTTNDSGTYAFFRTPPPAKVGLGGDAPAVVAGGDLRPARGQVRLTGFQLPSDYVDVDGDGRKDFVVTTIEIDGKNVMAAVMNGRVAARTRAFLNRSGRGGDAFFAGTPDAEVESWIGVKVRFTFTGSIEVKRSFTILATADLDGDGKKDLVIRSGAETLAVRRGVGSGVWESEPRGVAIPPMGDSPDVEGYAADLDGDGKDDLVLLYRAPPGGKDRTYVLMSP